MSSKSTRHGSTSKALTPASINGPYTDLKSKKTSWKRPFAYYEGPHTVIETGNSHDIDEEGVRLTYEMKTTVQAKVAGSASG